MKKAFTLIELLIVIAIIAILAGVVFINLNSARSRAKDSQIKSDLSEFSKALEVLKVDRDLVNTSGSNWTTLGESAAGTTDASIPNWKDVDGNPLLAKLPTHPISGGAYWVRIWTPSN
nr:prepilin-type N-terminal cleavage/methylation domain-containing protein [bacterium]